MMLPAPDAHNAAQTDKLAQADEAVQAGQAPRADAEMVARNPAPAPAPATAASSVDAVAGQQWSEVLALFVDDPRGSVAEASALVDEAIDAFIATARERQASLAASWRAEDADTEQLRMALQEYRTFWTSVTQLPQPA